MPIIGRGVGSGVPFNGGTITGPLVIDLSAKGTQDVEALKMILSADWPFSGRALELLIGTDRPFAINQNGELVTGGFDANLGGGSLTTAGGSVRVSTALGAGVQTLGPTDAGFFGHAAVVQPTGVPVTAAGIHAALVSLGLITA